MKKVLLSLVCLILGFIVGYIIDYYKPVVTVNDSLYNYYVYTEELIQKSDIIDSLKSSDYCRVVDAVENTLANTEYHVSQTSLERDLLSDAIRYYQDQNPDSHLYETVQNYVDTIMLAYWVNCY